MEPMGAGYLFLGIQKIQMEQISFPDARSVCHNYRNEWSNSFLPAFHCLIELHYRRHLFLHE